MKVQSGKGNVQSQVKSTTEDLSTQPPTSQSAPATDYFSSLINSMSFQPNADTEDNAAEQSDDNQVDVTQATEKQAGFDALFSALEFQYPAVDVNKAPIQQQTQLQQQEQITDFNPDVKAVIPATTPAVFNTNVIPEKVVAKNAATLDIPVKPDFVQMQQESSVLPPAKEALNAMLDLAALNQESMLVQKPPVSNTQQGITTRDVVAEMDDDVSDASEQTKTTPIRFNGPTFNTETNSTQSVTLLSLLKGQTYQPDEQANKYVDALVQMGGLINGETMRHFGAGTNQPGEMVMREASSVDYGEMISRASRPEYELKIDLLPLAAGSMASDVYTANIKIYPPELGSVIAKLKLDKKNAELTIVTENNRVKEVVEANLSQLKQQFQQSDINLTTIHVEVQTSDARQGQQQQQNPQTSDSKMSSNDSNAKNNTNKEPATKPQRLNSIIDTYI